MRSLPFAPAEAKPEDAEKEGEGEEQAERAEHQEDGELEQQVHPELGQDLELPKEMKKTPLSEIASCN